MANDATQFTDESGQPVSLSPEEQTQAAQILAQPETHPQTLIDPYQPLQYKDVQGNPIALTPKEKTDYRKQAGLTDPLLDLSPEDMVALAREKNDDPNKQFNIMAAFQAREKEVAADPEALQRVAEGWQKYKDSTGLGDLPNPAEVASNIWKTAIGLGKYSGKLLWELGGPQF